MARTYATVDVQNALAKMMAAVDQVKNDPRLDANYKDIEIGRLRKEGNAAAMAAHETKLLTIQKELQSAREDVFAELQKAESAVNWQRALFLQQSFVTMASHAPEIDNLRNSIALAIEGQDLDALRAWASAMPAVNSALRNMPEFLNAVPELASMLKAGLEGLEPQPLAAARGRLAEIEAASQQYEQQVKVISLQAAGGRHDFEFLRSKAPSIFDGQRITVQRGRPLTAPALVGG